MLHVIPSIAPRYGGPSSAVVGMCTSLQNRGVAVQIATTDADGPARLPVPHGRRMEWSGVPTVFFPRQLSEAYKYSRPLASWLAENVAEFDVVHVHAVFSHACLAASSACRRRGVPYVVRPLGTLDPWSLRQKPLRKRLLWHLGVQRMLRGAAAMHYTTASEKRLAETALDLQRGVVIPLGVDETLFRTTRSRGEPPYVLVLGRLHPKKGIESLVDVFLEVSERLPEWNLVVAGDGEPEYVASLRAHVARLDAHHRVVFRGWVQGQAKAAALAGAAVLALPSHQENFGLVVAEALACGTPVLVSTHVNLADEIAAANAGWVVPLDRAILRDRLTCILRNRCERERRGQAGRSLAMQAFRWSSVAGEVQRLYQSLLEAA
ncbi:MAG: glycosyltransferase [Chloroflexi bacterium]|nr:glycosyltransferase [Chloroflexota bacterium]